ncbi:MAG: hypothetical protein J4F36_13580 [Nitrosopumilaceae archaeon]|nr:hypothetical protein [Nitrosopumilaceae archaeon]
MVFVIAGFFGGIIQDVLLGASIGLLVNAFLTVGAVSNAVSRVSKRTGSS